MAAQFDEQDALSIVSFMDQLLAARRQPGIQRLHRSHPRSPRCGRLQREAQPAQLRRCGLTSFRTRRRGWDYRVGTVEFDGGSEAPLLSRERDRVSLAINSFSTPPGGITGASVDVGAGAASDYAGKDLKGAVVLGDAPLGRLWQEAVKRRRRRRRHIDGDRRYIRPSDPASMSESRRTCCSGEASRTTRPQRRSDSSRSWRAANRMRERLKLGAVQLSRQR